MLFAIAPAREGRAFHTPIQEKLSERAPADKQVQTSLGPWIGLPSPNLEETWVPTWAVELWRQVRAELLGLQARTVVSRR